MIDVIVLAVGIIGIIIAVAMVAAIWLGTGSE